MIKTMATCHCKRVSIHLATPPSEVTDCNCSLCCSYGVLWAYYPSSEVTISPDPSLTQTYTWNGRHVDFHRCASCGCVTHWLQRGGKDERRGVNARLMPPDVLASARVRHKDGAGSGEYLD